MNHAHILSENFQNLEQVAQNEKTNYLNAKPFPNVIFNNLVNLNFYESFRGAESVFYFPSSLRYFWSINKIFFGELFFGYLTIGFLYPIIYFYIFKHLFGTMWSLTLTLIVTFTRLFEGYALSIINMLQHINAGDAEPLAIFFFLLSLLIFLKLEIVIHFHE